MKNKASMLILSLFAFILASQAQTPLSLTLHDCYVMAEQNYPLIKQRKLISTGAAYTIENIQKGYLPQLNINGQASYQSAVTQVPIKLPGMDIPTISKDQYKLYGEITQVIYDGGVMEQQKNLQKTGEVIEQEKLGAELYKLKERINQLFFGILLIDEQLKQNDLLAKDIQSGLRNVQAAIDNGTAFKSNGALLRAELLKNNQRAMELKASRRAFTDMLGLFINKMIDTTVHLVKPSPLNASAQIKRPELLIYDEQLKNADIRTRMLKAKSLPKLGLFLQGGVGRPALNMLSNTLAGYYVGGLRLNWSPSAFYTIKKDRALIDIDRMNTTIQKETFLFNTSLLVKQQQQETSRYQELLASDDEIIDLRVQVKTAAMAQLENGVINGNDYLREANAEDQARQSKILHEIQLLISQYNQQTTTGNL